MRASYLVLYSVLIVLLSACGSGLCPLRSNAMSCQTSSGTFSLGVLDTTFGTAGIVTSDFGGLADFILSIKLQSTGKIIGAGYTFNANTDAALARFNSDGSLDTTFGTAGKVFVANGSDDAIASSAILADNSIVVSGYRGASDFEISKYSPDGALDTSFGTGGKTVTDISGVDQINCSLIQAGGKIVVGGGAVGYDDFALARYNPSGVLDTSFGIGGTATLFLTGGTDRIYGIGEQSDGKLVVGGITGTGVGIARYSADGVLDTTFGTSAGYTNTIAAGQLLALNILPDNKILGAGFTAAGFLLMRFTAQGILDTSFGTGGSTVTGPAGSRLYALVNQSDGKILVAGEQSNDFVLARYTSNGFVDSTFGISGKVTTDFAGQADRASSLILQADGTILLGGHASIAGVNHFALARYR